MHHPLFYDTAMVDFQFNHSIVVNIFSNCFDGLLVGSKFSTGCAKKPKPLKGTSTVLTDCTYLISTSRDPQKAHLGSLLNVCT